MFKVCHMTSTHKSHDQRILLKECVSLSANGYDVSLVVQGKSEFYRGVHIIGTGEEKGSTLYRLLIRPKKIYQAALKLNADIYQIHDMELLPYAVKLKRKGKKVIFDYHEDYASRFEESDVFHLPKWIMRFLGKLYTSYEKRSITILDAMISVTPHICDRLAKINPNTVMITNYPLINDGDWGAPVGYDSDSNYFCFAGQVSSAMYNLNIVAIAMQNFSDIRFKLCGPERRSGDIKKLQQLDISGRLDYLGLMPYKKLPVFLSGARAAIVICSYSKDSAGKYGTIGNNKLFEAMLRGIPVICTDFDLWKEIVDRYHCGICVMPGNENQLINAIDYIIKNPGEAELMGANGRRAVEQEFNWGTQEKKLLKLYENVALKEKVLLPKERGNIVESA